MSEKEKKEQKDEMQKEKEDKLGSKKELGVIGAIIKYVIFAILILMVGYTIDSALEDNKTKTIKNEEDIEAALESLNKGEEEALETEENQSENIKKDKKERKKIEKENKRFHILEDRDNLSVFIEENDLLLLEFRVHWCPYCKELEERTPEILKENEGLTLLQIDMDEHPELANFYQAASTPTLILYKDGDPYDRVSGALPTDVLTDWINGGL